MTTNIFDQNLDKIKGAILGHALGDALGMPSEFPPHTFYTGNLDVNISKSRFQGTRYFVKGQVSDDTEMTFALFNSMKNKTSTILEYMDFANSGNPCLGKNTRNLFKGVKTEKGYESRYKKNFIETDKETWTQSNGCLMRCYPFGLINRPDLAEKDCKLTNPSAICVEAVSLFIKSIHNAMYGMEKLDIVKKVVSEIKHPMLKIAIENSFNKDPKIRDISLNRGWVCHAFYCAYWSLLHFDDYKSAIDAVIVHSRNSTGSRVGDTDTNACISGALLGSYYGLKKLQENDCVSQFIKILFNCNTEDGDFPRPKKYLVSEENIASFCKVLIEYN